MRSDKVIRGSDKRIKRRIFELIDMKGSYIPVAAITDMILCVICSGKLQFGYTDKLMKK